MKKEETIFYRGKRIAVEIVSEINTYHSDGINFLLRDKQGRYYLKRELYDEGAGCCRARRTRQFNYRCYLHRISLVAAILWQADFGARRILRIDAGKFFKRTA